MEISTRRGLAEISIAIAPADTYNYVAVHVNGAWDAVEAEDAGT